MRNLVLVVVGVLVGCSGDAQVFKYVGPETVSTDHACPVERVKLLTVDDADYVYDVCGKRRVYRITGTTENGNFKFEAVTNTKKPK